MSGGGLVRGGAPPGSPDRDRLGAAQPAEQIVVVWDAPIRLCHWLIVVLVVAAYTTWRSNWMGWHSWAGSLVLALVIFRLLWG